jgi:hypothetical protein
MATYMVMVGRVGVVTATGGEPGTIAAVGMAPTRA